MQLQYPERGRLFEDAQPGRRVELARAAFEIEWIRAIRAGEWAAVRQLRQKPERRRKAHGSTIRLAARSRNRHSASLAIRARSFANRAAGTSAISASVRVPSQRRTTSTALAFACSTRSSARRT